MPEMQRFMDSPKKQTINKTDKAYNALCDHFFLRIKQIPQRIERIDREKNKMNSE
jgi:hypothetical protein